MANGNDRYTTEIVANEMQMLGGRGGGMGGGGGGYAEGGRGEGGGRGGSRGESRGGEEHGEPVRSSTEKDDFDDEIPF